MMDALTPTPPRWLTVSPTPAASSDFPVTGPIIGERSPAPKRIPARPVLVSSPDSSGLAPPQPVPGDGAAVDVSGLGDRGADGEVIEHPLPPGFAHPAPPARVGHQRDDRLRQSRAILGRNEQAGLATDHHVPMTRHV